MYILNNKTRYGKNLSPSLADHFLEGFSGCCLDTFGSALEKLRERLVGTMRNGWGMKKLLFPVSLGKLLIAGGFWGSSSFGAHPLALHQIPGVDPCVLPRTGIVPVPWSHSVQLSLTMPWHHCPLLSTEELGRRCVSCFSELIHSIDNNLKTWVGSGRFFPSLIPCTSGPYPQSGRETCPGLWDWVLN